ncbi:DNA translocase FtsK [Castellaniella sp. GW247-6E4]|uniref:DNA translocase FtsK n=1 Tax=Castellaniella sp. GW247-6E4 TaxID=3140380 RepID=UPI003314AD67
MQEPSIDHTADEWYEQAKTIVIQRQSVSISLIQRHLRIGYSIALSLMERLEADGIVTSLMPLGGRQLTSSYRRNHSMQAHMNPNLIEMLDKFYGCEGGDAGNATSPTIWLFGLEPGWSKRDQKRAESPSGQEDDGYSVETQLGWVYNRKAFKLFAAIEGIPVSRYREFAFERRPFERGSSGYFKGNLYPYACTDLAHWPEDAVEETGLTSKAEYQAWCAQYRWPAIKNWVDEHQPKLFIGVGNSFRTDFALSVFGYDLESEYHEILINGYRKKIYLSQFDGRKLAVVPHFSGRNGLNSDAAIEQAGALISDFLQR